MTEILTFGPKYAILASKRPKHATLIRRDEPKQQENGAYTFKKQYGFNNYYFLLSNYVPYFSLFEANIANFNLLNGSLDFSKHIPVPFPWLIALNYMKQLLSASLAIDIFYRYRWLTNFYWHEG